MRKKFCVKGMSCASCVSHVEKAVAKLGNSENINVSLLNNTLELDTDILTDEEIMKAFSLAEKEDTDFIVLTKICAKFSRMPKWLNPKEAGPHFNNAAMAIIGKKAGKALARYRNKNS